MKSKGLAATAAAVVAAAGLLFYSREIADGVRTGLHNCAFLLIPSLFPFMILAALIGCTTAGKRLSALVSAVVSPLTGLPKPLGAVFFMSIIGGFPVGARMLAQMLERNELDADTAGRALCCAVNAGPSFLITAVGVGMLGNRAAGLALLGAQLASCLCVAAVTFRGKKTPTAPLRVSPAGTDALVQSVRSASAGMLGVCSFVVAFSAIAALLRAAGILPLAVEFLGVLFPGLGQPFFAAALDGVLEVTAGCISAAALHTQSGFILCAFLVSFSSLSIIYQVKACFPPDCGVNFKPFYRSRLLHGGCTALFAAFFWRFIPQTAMTAVSPGVAPDGIFQPNMTVTIICLMAMFSILLLTPPGKQFY